MADLGTRITDDAVGRTERRLSRVYHQAAKDIETKLKAWEKGHAAREEKYRKQLADGKITQADFDAWMRGQVFQGRQWQARKEEIQNVLLNADKQAARIVNEGKLGVFAENANYIGWQLEKGARTNTGFTLYDERTVARLVKSDPHMLPEPKVTKGKAFAWYNRRVNNAVTQGIIQGESIKQIARRIADSTGESSYASAVRNARTAYTGAQNAGRMEGLHQAQDLGISVKKQWMATLDSKTRDAHADLDGQIRDIDEPFEVDGMEIDYPGDPSADPSLVYNCRCTLVYVYPDYPSDMQRRDNETGEIIGDMTYQEWEMMKEDQGEKQNEPHQEEKATDYSVVDLEEPTRPRRRDFDDEDEYYRERDKYRLEREEYEQRLDEAKEKALQYERFQSRADIDAWIKERGLTATDDVLDQIDPRAFNEASTALDEMFRRFPEVKSYTMEDFSGDTFKTSFNIGTTNDGLLSANGGFNFNPGYFSDYSLGINSALRNMTDGFLVRGDGTFSTLVRHEFGHNVQHYVENKLAMKYHYFVDDWRKNFSSLEEYRKAAEAYNREKRQYDSELLALAGLTGSSEYSNTNTLELFAEGFSEYTSGGHSEFGEKFGEFLKRWY